MGVTVTDTASVLIDNTLHRSTREALATMRKGAIDIRDLARKMAPVDEANLEGAIKSDDKDAGGINGRKRIEVFVDVDMPVPGRPGKVVGDYSDIMHEDVTYKLGKKSKAKQAANPGIKVGAKYLERAADELSPAIMLAVQNAVSKIL